MKILIAILALAASSAAGMWYGWTERDERAQIELARAVASARSIERQLNEQIIDLDILKNKEAKKYEQANAAYHAALRAGAVRLSIPAARPGPPGPAASGQPAEARAELDAEAAIRIDRIANEGDDAIRDLNQCIDLYELVRRQVNQGR